MVDPSLNWIFDIIGGSDWPQGDEDKLRALADEWDAVAAQVQAVGAGVPALTNKVTGSVGGTVGRHFFRYGQQLSGFEGDLASMAGQQAQMLRNQALNVENAKYSMIIQLAFTAAEILWAIADPFTMPLVPEFLAEGLAMMRALRARFGQGMHLILEAVDEGAEEIFQDLLAQLIQIGEGNRHGIDGQSVAMSAAFGAGAGAFAHIVKGQLQKYSPKFAGSWKGAATVEGVTELGVGAVSIPLGGDPGGLGWSVLNGGLSGAATHGAHKLGKNLHDAYTGVGKPGPHGPAGDGKANLPANTATSPNGTTKTDTGDKGPDRGADSVNTDVVYDVPPPYTTSALAPMPGSTLTGASAGGTHRGQPDSAPPLYTTHHNSNVAATTGDGTTLPGQRGGTTTANAFTGTNATVGAEAGNPVGIGAVATSTINDNDSAGQTSGAGSSNTGSPEGVNGGAPAPAPNGGLVGLEPPASAATQLPDSAPADLTSATPLSVSPETPSTPPSSSLTDLSPNTPDRVTPPSPSAAPSPTTETALAQVRSPEPDHANAFAHVGTDQPNTPGTSSLPTSTSDLSNTSVPAVTTEARVAVMNGASSTVSPTSAISHDTTVQSPARQSAQSTPAPSPATGASGPKVRISAESPTAAASNERGQGHEGATSPLNSPIRTTADLPTREREPKSAQTPLTEAVPQALPTATGNLAQQSNVSRPEATRDAQFFSDLTNDVNLALAKVPGWIGGTVTQDAVVHAVEAYADVASYTPKNSKETAWHLAHYLSTSGRETRPRLHGGTDRADADSRFEVHFPQDDPIGGSELLSQLGQLADNIAQETARHRTARDGRSPRIHIEYSPTSTISRQRAKAVQATLKDLLEDKKLPDLEIRDELVTYNVTPALEEQNARSDVTARVEYTDNLLTPLPTAIVAEPGNVQITLPHGNVSSWADLVNAAQQAELKRTPVLNNRLQRQVSAFINLHIQEPTNQDGPRVRDLRREIRLVIAHQLALDKGVEDTARHLTDIVREAFDLPKPTPIFSRVVRGPTSRSGPSLPADTGSAAAAPEATQATPPVRGLVTLTQENPARTPATDSASNATTSLHAALSSDDSTLQVTTAASQPDRPIASVPSAGSSTPAEVNPLTGEIGTDTTSDSDNVSRISESGADLMPVQRASRQVPVGGASSNVAVTSSSPAAPSDAVTSMSTEPNSHAVFAPGSPPSRSQGQSNTNQGTAPVDVQGDPAASGAELGRMSRFLSPTQDSHGYSFAQPEVAAVVHELADLAKQASETDHRLTVRFVNYHRSHDTGPEPGGFDALHALVANELNELSHTGGFSLTDITVRPTQRLIRADPGVRIVAEISKGEPTSSNQYFDQSDPTSTSRNDEFATWVNQELDTHGTRRRLRLVEALTTAGIRNGKFSQESASLILNDFGQLLKGLPRDENHLAGLFVGDIEQEINLLASSDKYRNSTHQERASDLLRLVGEIPDFGHYLLNVYGITDIVTNALTGDVSSELILNEYAHSAKVTADGNQFEFNDYMSRFSSFVKGVVEDQTFDALPITWRRTLLRRATEAVPVRQVGPPGSPIVATPIPTVASPIPTSAISAAITASGPFSVTEPAPELDDRMRDDASSGHGNRIVLDTNDRQHIREQSTSSNEIQTQPPLTPTSPLGPTMASYGLEQTVTYTETRNSVPVSIPQWGEPTIRGQLVLYRDRYVRFMVNYPDLLLPPEQLDASLARLGRFVEIHGAKLEDYVDTVFLSSNPTLAKTLQQVVAALHNNPNSRLNDDSLQRFINDTLMSSLLVSYIENHDGYARRWMPSLSPLGATKQISGLIDDLKESRNPFSISGIYGDLVDIDGTWPTDSSWAQTSTRILLTKINQDVRGRIVTDPLFAELMRTPASLTEALFAGTGHTQISFTQVTDVANISSQLRDVIPTAVGLIAMGEHLTEQIQEFLGDDAQNPTKKESPIHRTARRRVAKATEQFTAMRDSIKNLLAHPPSRPDAHRKAWVALTPDWAYHIQKLAVLPLGKLADGETPTSVPLTQVRALPELRSKFVRAPKKSNLPDFGHFREFAAQYGTAPPSSSGLVVAGEGWVIRGRFVQRKSSANPTVTLKTDEIFVDGQTRFEHSFVRNTEESSFFGDVNSKDLITDPSKLIGAVVSTSTPAPTPPAAPSMASHVTVTAPSPSIDGARQVISSKNDLNNHDFRSISELLSGSRGNTALHHPLAPGSSLVPPKFTILLIRSINGQASLRDGAPVTPEQLHRTILDSGWQPGPLFVFMSRSAGTQTGDPEKSYAAKLHSLTKMPVHGIIGRVFVNATTGAIFISNGKIGQKPDFDDPGSIAEFTNGVPQKLELDQDYLDTVIDQDKGSWFELAR